MSFVNGSLINQRNEIELAFMKDCKDHWKNYQVMMTSMTSDKHIHKEKQPLPFWIEAVWMLQCSDDV